jgi:antirestriction protein ArdC
MAENIYDRVTNAIVASLEKGVDAWSRPWTVKPGATSPLPYNIASGANYRGINTVYLLNPGLSWISPGRRTAV